MLNSNQLFSRRLRQDWKYQYNIFKTIADWTVMLYILIPAAVIILVVYRSLWSEIPQWIELIPFSLLFALFFLFIWGGHFRTYVRDADRIFLIKNRSLHLGLKRNGIFYSYAIQLLHTAFLSFLIAPFWFNYYQLGIEQFILYLGLFLSSKWLIMGVKGKLNVHLRGWKSLLRGVPIFIGVATLWMLYYQAFQVNQVLLMIGVILINVFGSIILVRRRFNSLKTFEQDLAVDELEKNKYIELIFSISMEIEKPPKPLPLGKSPIIYSKSNRLFRKRSPRNGFLELFIKVTTRNVEYILRYFQIIGITSVAIVLIPLFWYNVAIVTFGFLFVRTWTRGIWDRVIAGNSFTMKYTEKNAYASGKRIVTLVLSLLFLTLIGLSFIARSWIYTQV